MNLVNVNNLGNSLSMLAKRAKDFIITESTPKGVTDLRLSIIGEETLTADCDVTDHYVESNTAYQDQVSLKPKIYTIQGEVGELVWYQRDPIEQGIGQVAQRLEGVISFLPIRSKKFNQTKKKVMKTLQWIDTASNAIDKINKLSSSEGNSQQQAYNHLMKLRQDRMPISIKTPWGQLDDYVITNLKLTQPKETRDKTLISITLKEFRTTSVKAVPFDFSKYQGNAAFEAQPEVDNGTTSGEVIETTETESDGTIVKEIENEEGLFQCTIDPQTFQPTRIVDKVTGEEILQDGGMGSVVWDDFEVWCAEDVQKAIAEAG